MNISTNIRHKSIQLIQIIYFSEILFLGFVYYLRNSGYSVDDSFITYRYAYNLKEGFGLVFNVGENYYGTTAAGYAVILAGLSAMLDVIFRVGAGGMDAPTIQNVSVALSALSIGVAAVCLPFISQSGKSALRWFVYAAFAAYLFVGLPFNEVAGHETYAFLAVAFLATVLAGNALTALGGCILAIATTIRPDTILFVPILVLLDWGRSQSPWRMYFTRRSFWRFCFGYASIIVPWLIYLWIHFGQLTPGTMDAKKVQVALGYWPLYTPQNLFKYLVEAPDNAALFVMGVGLFACILTAMKTRVVSALLQDRGIFIAISWLLFGTVSACAYFLFNVTFWHWYGVPVLFSLGVASFVGWRIILDQFNTASISLMQNNRLAVFVRAVPIIVIGLLSLSASGKFYTWYSSTNVNAHIHAYTEIADYLKRAEPAGTTIQMFEPGSFGYGLGPTHKSVNKATLEEL